MKLSVYQNYNLSLSDVEESDDETVWSLSTVYQGCNLSVAAISFYPDSGLFIFRHEGSMTNLTKSKAIETIRNWVSSFGKPTVILSGKIRHIINNRRKDYDRSV